MRSHLRNVVLLLAVLAVASPVLSQQRTVAGTVVDETGDVIPGVVVTLVSSSGTEQTTTDAAGRFLFSTSSAGFTLQVQGRHIRPLERRVAAEGPASDLVLRVQYSIAPVRQSIVITATAADPGIDLRNDAVYKNTLFSRDDQLLDTLASGINAGQHEGGGKSVEVRRFGFNLDHGGVSGGLKVLVDNVQQNHATQGHGQGYLGQLKSLSPELVDEVEILNGPFSAEYGDFSGLGVVHIRLKERLADRLTVRAQGGSFGAFRGFVAYSPRWTKADSFIAYEDARTDGPFANPSDYVRNNLTGNTTLHLADNRTLGFKANVSRNVFDSSGQIPLDYVWSGSLDRFGFVDPDNGGNNRSGNIGTYFKQDFAGGDTFRADAFLSRSMVDLWSNFTFFLSDPIRGDEILQHDSRLQEGANVQWLHPWKLMGQSSLLTLGGNVHQNHINVTMLHTEGRVPFSTGSSAHAQVGNVGLYAQQGIDLDHGRVHLDAGLRYDTFHFDVVDRIDQGAGGSASQGRVQPKANVVWSPLRRLPATLHASYGRGISSADARGIVRSMRDPEHGNEPKIATTDFYQLGASTQVRRFSMSTSLFLIDRSNEQVYVPDDGTIEFKGPSRTYGWEAKASLQLHRHLSFNSGVTQVSNAFYRAESPRVYVDSAPHTVLNSAVTLAGWKGMFSSLRYRHISSYILDGSDPTIRASGADVVDWSITKSLPRNIDLNFAIDNLTNHRYYETQNYFVSRMANEPAEGIARIHATPGYSRGFTAGITFHLE